MMHELPVTERILDIALRHVAGKDVRRILVIHLRVGELSDLQDEWIQRYFDYLSKGTPAEKARLAITRAPILLRCEDCSRSFAVKKSELADAHCPDCEESKWQLVSGREYVVENLEVV